MFYIYWVMIFLQALFLNFPVIRNIYHSIVFLYLAVLFLEFILHFLFSSVIFF